MPVADSYDGTGFSDLFVVTNLLDKLAKAVNSHTNRHIVLPMENQPTLIAEVCYKRMKWGVTGCFLEGAGWYAG